MIGRVGADAQVPALQRMGGAQDLDRLQLEVNMRKVMSSRLRPISVTSIRRLRRSNRRTPNRLLQRPDLAGQGRLGHVQHLGGLGEAALGGDGVKGAKLAVTYRCHLWIV